ncbi:MAG: RagB/SusD family nutrient uptake outer membrane protein [Bacteroidota bacterium]
MIHILKFICLSLLFLGCSEEFLEINPQGSLNPEVLNNKAGVETSLIATYAMLDGWNNSWADLSPPWATSGSNWIWGSVASDDAYKGSEAGDREEISQIELYQWGADNPYLDAKFKALYEGISRANTTKKLLLDAEDISVDEQARLDGEIRFLRAHFHFEAVKIWGKVPYYDETDEYFKKPNELDIIPDIIADLELAIASLPISSSEKGRATKGAAQAYLGKIYLYQGNWREAKTQLEALVNSGQYALNDCFQAMFTTADENGAEMIFSIQASVNDGTEGGENGNFGDRLNFPHGASPFGCCGFHQPSQNLVNAYKVDAQGLPLLDTFNDTDVDPQVDAIDPRVDWTVGRDGVPYLDWGIHAANWIRDRDWAGPFSPKKFTHRRGEESTVGWSNLTLSPINIPIIRYADVLLMLAEAEVELANLEAARELVNRIRQRAANCAQGPLEGENQVPINDASISWAQYKVEPYRDAWLDQERARKAVRFERRLELALEGHRLFDLRRWGIAQQVLNTYLAIEQTKRNYLSMASPYELRHEFFPLPTNQIELSREGGVAQLIQNTGW